MPTPIKISSKRWKPHVGASMTQTCDGEMAIRCVSTWQILDSNYAIVKVLFKPDANDSVDKSHPETNSLSRIKIRVGRRDGL